MFGVELDFLLQRECPEDEVPAGTVPAVLERLINEVEQRGLTEVGICTSLFRQPFSSNANQPHTLDRIAGAHSEVNTLRDALNRGKCHAPDVARRSSPLAAGEWPISELTDIHAVCDLIKSWFRVLPGGLFPADTYGAILNAAGT